ncbi:MAG: ABC transporter permease [Candidatus Bathyarchaeia archaeon]
MRKPILIFKAVTKNWIRSRSGVFFSILFPVLLLLVFGAIFSGSGSAATYRLFIQNFDITAEGKPTDLSKAFIDALNLTKTFAITEVPLDVDVKDYARHALGPFGGYVRVLMISEGFQEDLLNGAWKVRVGISYNTLNTTYYVIEPYLNENEKTIFQQGLFLMSQYNETLPYTRASLTIILDAADQSSAIVKSIVMNVANAVNYQLIRAENIIEFTEESIADSHFRTVDYYVPGITAAFIMTNGIIGLTANTTEFKRRGVIKRLSITPLSKMDWVLGNVLSQTILNLMLTAFMLAIGWIVFNVQVIPDIPCITLIFLGSVMFSGMGMLLSGLVKDVEAASALGNAIAFPMMFLSGTYFPIEIMPSYIQSISRVLPLTYFSEARSEAR